MPRERLLGGHVKRQIGGGEQVEGAPHHPGLDQSEAFPWCPPDRIHLEIVCPGPEGQLGGREDLGVHPTDPGGYVEHRC